MKKYIVSIIALLCSAAAMAQNEISCGVTTYSSNITTNTTFSTGTVYRITGCVHVTSGATLTVQDKVNVVFQKSSNASLTIDPGAYLIVQGTSANPVVFTSDQTVNNKAYGDWGGLIIAGNASNNVSGGTVSVSRTCSASGGGSTDADSSGNIQYLRIEYASYGLTLLSVGSKTVINNVMTSFIANNAFEFLGGTVNAKDLISYNAKGDDFLFNFGNRSLVQFALSVRLDANAHLAAGSNGIVLQNDNTGSSNTPKTHPVISDATLIGPYFCGGTGLSSDFKNGVLYQLNAEGGVYNSFISKWPTGFLIQDASTLSNANINLNLNFSENSLLNNNTIDATISGTWPTSMSDCAGSFSDWVTNMGSCTENNEFGVTPSGYNATAICGTYSTTPPSFILSSPGIATVDYIDDADLSSSFFTKTGTRYHGGFNTSDDWTATWSNWNPQGFDPCAARKENPASIINVNNSIPGLLLAPNPGNGTTYALFNAPEPGKVSISVMDNVGRLLYTTQSSIEKGSQRIAVNTKGLATGLYIVKVTSTGGTVLLARLTIE